MTMFADCVLALEISHQQRAASSQIARHRVSPKRPPARPAWGGPRKTRLHYADREKNAKNTARPS